MGGSLDVEPEMFGVLFESASFAEGSLSAISSSVTSGVECSTVMSTSDELLDPLEPLLSRCAMLVHEYVDEIEGV